MESERLNEYVRSAWLGQREWIEEQRKIREAEDKRAEEEAQQAQELQVQREAAEARDKQVKRENYQKDLEDQLEMMRLLT